MSQILITPPLVEPVTLVEAKAHLRVTHADDDDYIGKLIAAARRQVEMRTGLRLMSQVWRVFFDAWPENGVLCLPLSPLISVNELKILDADDVSVTVDPAHYVVDVATSRLALRPGRSVPRVSRTLGGVQLLVTAGFGASAANVPQELKQAVLLIVGHWFAHRGDTEMQSLPLSVQDTLRTFRVRRIA